MSIVTAPQSSIPDYEHEYHTIVVDTLGQVSKNTFSTFIQQPLEIIVQARLLAAQIHTASSNVCYISVSELDSNFNQTTTRDLSLSSRLNNYFGAILCDGSGKFNFTDNYPVVQQYITPIRKLSRLSFTIRNENGDTISGTTDNHFIIRLVCKKSNLQGR